MPKKRKPSVDDLADRRYRNDPESRNLTPEEVTLFEAARQAIGLLKKTFETWTIIGKAVRAARARADRIGGGKTFRRILEQQGLAKVVPPATATRLLQIMERLPEVQAWHASLTEQQQVAWASPSAVVKHCTVFAKAKAKAPFPQASRPVSKKRVEHAIDEIVDYCRELARAERMRIVDRILSPLDLQLAAEPRAGKPEPKAAKPEPGLTMLLGTAEKLMKPSRRRSGHPAKAESTDWLQWVESDNPMTPGHSFYKAAGRAGEYSISSMTAFPSGKFAGYSVWYYPKNKSAGKTTTPIKDRVRTAVMAKAIAQRHHDRGGDA
jgi:hypothetical protein